MTGPAGIPGALVCEAAADEVTLVYAAAVREAFDLLRQVAGQLAGVLALAVAGGHGAAGHPMLALADTALRTAADSVRSRPPPAGALREHDHLSCAAAQLERALAAARLHRNAEDARTDAVLVPLRAGFQELQWASGLLPGCEVVAFTQGCCARHAPPGATRLISGHSAT